MSNISERKLEVVDRFTRFEAWEDRYKELIVMSKELDALEEEHCTDKFKIKGCQSQVWVRPSYVDGSIFFKAQSDAVLVKGIIALIVYVFSGSSPEEILEGKDEFLKEIGITEHLSMNRTNGLASMLKQIKMYAMIFKSLKDKGVMNADNI